MPIDLDKLKKQLTGQAKKAGSGVGVDHPLQIELRYGNQLIKQFVTPVTKDIESKVLSFLKAKESEYVKNVSAKEVDALFSALRKKWSGIADEAEKLAAEMANSTDEFNRKKRRAG